MVSDGPGCCRGSAEEPRNRSDAVGEACLLGSAGGSVPHAAKAGEAAAQKRAGLGAREPSVLREPALELAFARPMAGEGAKLDAADAGIRQHRKGDDRDLPEVEALD